jgi:hypothetical protein
LEQAQQLLLLKVAILYFLPLPLQAAVVLPAVVQAAQELLVDQAAQAAVLRVLHQVLLEFQDKEITVVMDIG